MTEPATSQQDRDRAKRISRYTHGVSAAMIVLCNAVFLLGLWGSGINLDGLIRIPDQFDPAQDICLRLDWHRVTGATKPVRLCQEWIDLSDPSGNTHTFQPDVTVVRSADGTLYFDQPARVDYRLFLVAAFLIAVIASGLSIKRYLIARYRLRLDATEQRA